MREAEEEAIGWLLRLRGADAADWQAFTAWLEQDPAHALAYDRVALADADAIEALRRQRSRPIAAAAGASAGRSIAAGRRWARRSGIAAALAASVAGALVLTRGGTVYTEVTAPGEHRALTLADGTRVALNGGSRLVLDRRDPRRVELASGEASFTVVHNADKPFEIVAGDATLRDVGTRFDVRRRDAVTEVAVSEGAVLYNPDREAVTLAAGDRLRDPDGPAAIERGRIVPEMVGQWRKGQLSFDNERLARVAAEIMMTSGAPLTVSPALADRRFTGTITLGSDRAALVRRLQPLLDVAAIPRADGWELVPVDRRAH